MEGLLLLLLLFAILWLVDKMLDAAVRRSRSRNNFAEAARPEGVAVETRLVNAPEAQPSTTPQGEPCPVPDP